MATGALGDDLTPDVFLLGGQVRAAPVAASSSAKAEVAVADCEADIDQEKRVLLLVVPVYSLGRKRKKLQWRSCCRWHGSPVSRRGHRRLRLRRHAERFVLGLVEHGVWAGPRICRHAAGLGGESLVRLLTFLIALLSLVCPRASLNSLNRALVFG